MGRRWKVVAVAVVGLGLLLATLPWWMGAVLVPVARTHGLAIGSYERIGMSRFALHQLRYTRGLVTVTADQLEADSPALWLWRHWRGTARPVAVSRWSVAVAAGPPRLGPSPAGFVHLRVTLLRVSAGLRRWLAGARLGSGSVRWPNGGFTLGGAEWHTGVFTAQDFAWLGQDMAVRAEFPRSGPIAVRVGDARADWRADLAWTESRVGGRLRALSQDVDLAGSFAPTGWLPVEATITAPALDFPADRAGLGGVYARVQGRGDLHWRAGRFQLAIAAAAHAPAGSRALPLTVSAAAEGTRSRWTVTALDAHLPGAEAHLDQPVTFAAGRMAALNPARLTFAVDLEQVLFSAARGRLKGWVEVAAGAGPPNLAFSIQLAAGAWRQWTVEQAAVRGALQWPRLTVASAVLELGGPNRVTAQGGYDFHTRRVQAARAEGQLGRAWLSRFLPSTWSAESAQFSVQAAGMMPELAHQGTLEVKGLHLPPLQPQVLQATWSGRGRAADRFAAHLAAGATALDLAGSADAAGVRLTDLRFAPGGRVVWTLAAPARIAWQPAWRIEHLRLAGTGTALALDMNDEEAGGALLALSHFSSVWCRDLVVLPGEPWTVNSLRVAGRAPGGRLVFTAQAEVDLKVPAFPATVTVQAQGDGTAVLLDEAARNGSGAVFARAHERLPVGWRMQGSPHWLVDNEAPLVVQVEVDPASPIWAPLAESFGLVLSRPSVAINLTGTVRRPVGQVDLSVGRLASARRTGPAFPALEDLAVRLRADPTEVTLDTFTGRIAGQPLRASGHWPIGPGGAAGFWRAWDWKNAEAQLEVANADLAPLALAFPKLLAPQGHWDLHLALVQGNWTGRLAVRDAATRPSTPVGIISGITADATMSGRTLEVQNLSATLGGQQIRVQGRAVFPTGALPQFSFTLQGDNIPFVRRSDMLMRGDFRLRADPQGAGGTLVSGSVALRDGLFLADLADLLPRGASGVARPPPYFSVDFAPFNRWQLAVDLTGDRTIRIRTALFHGEASARFRLFGTLEEPRAVGEVRIDQGQILLPFATFEVQIGAVRLTAIDPFTPQVDVVATAERNDYDLRMQASGPADAPTITFTSNPALPSDQVLLLVMTGQVPTLGTPLGGSTTQVAGLGAYLGQGLFQGSGSSRLGIISGQQISVKGRPTYEVDYRLNDRWSLVGEYDQFDEYNADVKWRVFRRGKDNGAP